MQTQTTKRNITNHAPLAETRGPIIRRHETWSAGDHAHQGDIIFVCIAGLPKSAKLRADRQLAQGTTIGSRHVLDGGECFDADPARVADAIYAATNGHIVVDPRYIGPVFTGPATVTHPQHQDQAFPDVTVTACVYQRNMDAEEREVRARD